MTAPLLPASPPAAGQNRTVERALDLLAHVCDGGAPSLTECARTIPAPGEHRPAPAADPRGPPASSTATPTAASTRASG